MEGEVDTVIDHLCKQIFEESIKQKSTISKYNWLVTTMDSVDESIQSPLFHELYLSCMGLDRETGNKIFVSGTDEEREFQRLASDMDFSKNEWVEKVFKLYVSLLSLMHGKEKII